MNYQIHLGKQGSADCCLKINNKEYYIESKAWLLIESIHKYLGFGDSTPTILVRYQDLLKIIYDNYDDDLTNQPQPMECPEDDESKCTYPECGCR